MKFAFRITQPVLDRARYDLARPHAFAYERVGFFSCRFGILKDGTVLSLVHNYHAVADDHYIEDHRFGALIGSNAFRSAMQLAYDSDVGIVHVHMHDHIGPPSPSRTDLHETQLFVPDFFNVRPRLPHGAVILSRDYMSGRMWSPLTKRPVSIDEIVIVGSPLQVLRTRNVPV